MLAIYGLGRIASDTEALPVDPVVPTRPIIDRTAQPIATEPMAVPVVATMTAQQPMALPIATQQPMALPITTMTTPSVPIPTTAAVPVATITAPIRTAASSIPAMTMTMAPAPMPTPPKPTEPVMAIPMSTGLLPTTYAKSPAIQTVFDPTPTMPTTAATPTVTVSPPTQPPPTAPPFTPMPQPGTAVVFPDAMSAASSQAATPAIAIGPTIGPATLQPSSSRLPAFIVGLSPVGKAALGIGLLALIGIAIHRITKRRR